MGLSKSRFGVFSSGLLFVVSTTALVACNQTVDKAPAGGFHAASVSENEIDFEVVKENIFDQSCKKCHGAGSENGDFSTYASVMAFTDEQGHPGIVKGQPTSSAIFESLQNNGGLMPKHSGPLSASQVTLLKEWITAGAPENAGDAHSAPVAPSASPGEEPSASPSASPGDEPSAPQPVADPDPAPAPPVTQAPPSVPAPAPAAPLPTNVSYASLVQPILQAKCVMCHSGAKPAAQIDLSSYNLILNNTTADTPLVVPGSSAKSDLFQEIDGGDMPPPKAIKAGKVLALTPDEKATIQAWIDGGLRP